MKYHDYNILSYSVDCQEGVITMDIGRPKQPEIPNEKIIFSGVIGYRFKDAMGSIILDIEEKEKEEFIMEHSKALTESYRRHGIPKFWRDEIREIMDALKEMTVWKISSSVGFDGYVIGSAIHQPEQGESGQLRSLRSLRATSCRCAKNDAPLFASNSHRAGAHGLH